MGGKILLTLLGRWWALQLAVTSIRGLARLQSHLPLCAKAVPRPRLPPPLEWYIFILHCSGHLLLGCLSDAVVIPSFSVYLGGLKLILLLNNLD